MIRRLIEADYAAYSANATPAKIHFWLRESRTPELLLELAKRFPSDWAEVARERQLLQELHGGDDVLESALATEQAAERTRDRAYWEPLKRELELLRHSR